MKKICVVWIVLVQLSFPLIAQIPFSVSDLPLVFIDTKGETIIEDTKIDADMGIVWSRDEENFTHAVFNNYDGLIGIEIRGNSSAGWPKKPYKVETRNADNSNNNVPLIGLPAENDWVLHAPCMDKSLMRNALMYRIVREMGWYAPRYKYCNLIINDSYQGVYVLIESLKLDKNRINIDNPSNTTSPDSITGGYIIEMTSASRLNEGEPFITGGISGHILAISSPKPEDLTPDRTSYIGDYINEFEDRLNSKIFSGTDDYKNLINVESFIDHMLIAEVYRQLDAFCASHYFTKDTNDLLMMGPAWDFNRTLGNYANWGAPNTDDFWLLNPRSDCRPFWSMNMYDDASFMSLYTKRYRELRENIFSMTHIFRIFDEYNAFIGVNIEHDYDKWPLADRNKGVPEPHFSFDEEMNYIQNWLSKRFAWLDEQWNVTAHPIINEIFANGTQSNKQWIELYNPYEKSVNISGWKLVLNNGESSYTIPPNTSIASENYIIVSVARESIARLPDGATVVENLNFALDQEEMLIQLQNSSSQVQDEISVSINEAWPDVSASGNYSIGLNPWFIDNSDGANWNWSKTAYGTPAATNENFIYEGLLISEVMSSNSKTIADSEGEYDDWVELYNGSDYPINLLGLFLSDDEVITWKWKVQGTVTGKETILNPGQTVIIWTDNDTEQGVLHAGFKLGKSGDAVVLSRSNGFENLIIDQVLIPPLVADQSYMRTDSAGTNWMISDHPNPGYVDLGIGIHESISVNGFDAGVYPNPVEDYFTVDFMLEDEQDLKISLIGLDGQQIAVIAPQSHYGPGRYTLNYHFENQIASGIYILRIRGQRLDHSMKILIL